MDVRDAGKAAIESVVPVSVSVSHAAGLSIPQVVQVLTGIYIVLQILRLFPRIIGCALCFWRHGTCDLSCKENK